MIGADLSRSIAQIDMLLKRNEVAEAENIIAKALPQLPRQPALYYFRAKVFRAKAEHKAAAASLKQATQLAPNDAGLRAEYARSLDDAGEHALSVATYDEVLQRKPDFTDAAIDRAVVLARRLNDERGFAELERLGFAARPSLRALRNLASVRYNAGQLDEAAKASSQGLALSPEDPGFLRIDALIAFDRGKASSAKLQKAAVLNNDPSLQLKVAAAHHAEGHSQSALDLLDALTSNHPSWVEAHRAFAYLASETASSRDPLSTFERAARQSPDHSAFWCEFARLSRLLHGEDAELEVLNRALKCVRSTSELDLARFAAMTESKEPDSNAALLDRIAQRIDGEAIMAHVRWLARMHRFDELERRAETLLGTAWSRNAWPYLHLAWRGLASPKSEWLEQNGQLVREIDLKDRTPPLTDLAQHLRTFHRTSNAPLEQSVRGGSQTDAALFNLDTAIIRDLREAMELGVNEYLAELPRYDADHPLLSKGRDTFRFSGSWSVRLRDRGRHVAHYHSAGDISSAFYVALPDAIKANDKNSLGGRLVLGQPPAEFGLDWDPVQCIVPVEGKLVLFPSWMWHGTTKFENGERLSVAFDVTLPDPV